MERFKKYLRTPDEDVKVRNGAAFSEEKLQKIKQEFVDYVVSNYKQNRSESADLKAELGEDIEEKIEKVFEEATVYFYSLGIDKVSFNEFFLDKGDFKDYSGIASRSKGVHVTDSGLEVTELRQLFFLKTLAHELYHSTASASLTIREKIDHEQNLHRDVQINEGASYDTKDDPLLLEEGLATRFEECIFNKIKTEYSADTVELYEHAAKLGLQHTEKPEDNDIFTITLAQEPGTDQITVSASGYLPAKKFVNFLEKEIPEFSNLVEKARLNRETISLARAIENRFGKGSYRLITTAKVVEADQILEKLIGERSSNIVP